MRGPVGRCALRVEGDWWVAYFAEPATMKDAVEMGRIRMTVVQDPARKQAFIDLMQSFVGDVIEERMGVRPDFGLGAAPEHERAGRA